MNTKDIRSKVKQHRRKVMVSTDYDLFDKEQFKIFRRMLEKDITFLGLIQ